MQPPVSRSVFSTLPRLAVALALAAALTSTSTAAGAASYAVDGAIVYRWPSPTQPTVLESFGLSLPVPIGRGVKDDQPGVQDLHAQASALADAGGVHAHAYSQIIHNVSQEFSNILEYDANADAQVTIDDMFISGPVGVTSTVAPINFHLSGSQLLGYYVPSFPSFVYSVSSIQMQVAVGSSSDGGFRTIESVNGAPPFVNTTGLGMLTGWTGNNDIQTQPFTMPVNTPFSMSLFLNVLAYTKVDFKDSFNAAANTDFSGTLAFATDVPVFALPAGYTANSVEGGIVNNQFVPEPSTGLLVLSGLLGFAARRRGCA
jgi:hypothetical protein